jgi:L-seryl-tRNA(Ser) seleniumtransferase
MATVPIDELRARADAIASSVARARVVDTEAVAGGGSLPGLTIPSVGVAVDVSDADAALARLRGWSVVARIVGGAVVCDLRTVETGDDARLVDALRGALT